MRRGLLVAGVAPLAVVLGCDSAGTPPAADAKLCKVTMASWWFDATGGGNLEGALDGDDLPLTNPEQSKLPVKSADCRVFADGKQIGEFRAELTSADETGNSAQNIAKAKPELQFEALGHKGALDAPVDEDKLPPAWWTCGSTLLRVELLKPKDQDQGIELLKTLAARVAGVVGCPGPTPKPA